jgi:hypothetical protein
LENYLSSRNFGKSTSNYPFRQADLPGQQNWTLLAYGAKSKLIKASLADKLPNPARVYNTQHTPLENPEIIHDSWRRAQPWTPQVAACVCDRCTITTVCASFMAVSGKHK